MPTPHGDNHDLWIDPTTTARMIEGNDGGACVTFNGGETWSTIYNQPTAQFYHVTTDDQFPYRVYGSQQDNTRHQRPERDDRRRHPRADWYAAGRRRERLHRGQAGRAVARRRLRSGRTPRLQRHHDPLRPPHRPGSATSPSGRSCTAGASARRALKYRLPVDLPDPLLAARPARALRRRQRRLPLDRHGGELGGRQPRPDAQRPGRS